MGEPGCVTCHLLEGLDSNRPWERRCRGRGRGWTHDDNDDTLNEHLQRKANWPEGGGREDMGQGKWSEA